MKTVGIVVNRPKAGLSKGRIIQNIISIGLFFVIAVVALLTSLGYRVNWQARELVQTGVIELSGPANGLPIQLYVDGKLEANTLPFREAWLFPGTYHIEIKKDGYQIWQKNLLVDVNKRTEYSSILLLYTSPRQAAVPSGVDLSYLKAHPEKSNGIVIANGNELMVNGQYLTSTSQNIVSAHWYPDGEHIVYQAGKELILYDLDSKTTQSLVTVSSANAAPYVFEDGGRSIVYSDNGALKAVTLYDAVTLIDRLAAVR